MLIDYLTGKKHPDEIRKGPKAKLARVAGEPSANKLIAGDNLLVLRTLADDPTVAGKVKLVYVDPPFATNTHFRIGEERTSTISSGKGDSIAYSDTMVDAEFLTFLFERLSLVRDLMADDGSIYLHIDSKIGHYVKIVMDDVFGRKNFRNEISRIKCNPKNFDRRAFGNIKDVILFYGKSERSVWNDPRVALDATDIERRFNRTDANGRRFATIPLHAPGETNGKTGMAWRGVLPPVGRHWRSAPDALDELDRQGHVEWSKNGVPRKRIYADDGRGKKVQDVWEFKDPPYPSYPTEKNLDMLKLIVETSSNEGDLVLDCFAGSGTTLVAAQISNRNWIGVDKSPHAIAVAKERLGLGDGKRAPAGAEVLSQIAILEADEPTKLSVQSAKRNKSAAQVYLAA
jgi:adenine-specific DNA-methyltransferase